MAKLLTQTTGRRERRRALPARRLFNVDEYYQMAEAGILNEDDRVELIEGEIIQMPPIGINHAGCVIALNTLLSERARGLAVVDVQNPLRLSQRLEPQPDLMLLRLSADSYRTHHPTAEDVLLVIEVSDTTLAYDRGIKLPLYARAGVPEVWIIDLAGQRIEAYRELASRRYQESVVYERGSSLAPAAFPDLSISVDEILG